MSLWSMNECYISTPHSQFCCQKRTYKGGSIPLHFNYVAMNRLLCRCLFFIKNMEKKPVTGREKMKNTNVTSLKKESPDTTNL